MEQPSNSNNQEINLNEDALKQTLRLIHSEVKDMSSHIQETELYRSDQLGVIKDKLETILFTLKKCDQRTSSNSCTSQIPPKIVDELNSLGIRFAQPKATEKVSVSTPNIGINIPESLLYEYTHLVSGHEAQIVEFIVNVIPYILKPIAKYYGYYEEGK